MPVAFQCRAKPQKCDALEVFLEARRTFIGYPWLRHDADYDPQALRTCLVDPTCPDEVWQEQMLHNPEESRE